MDHLWQPRCPPPRNLVAPVQVDPAGLLGPTPGQARGRSWRRTSPRHYVPATVDDRVVEQRILEQSVRLPPGGAVTGWAALRLAGGGFFDGLAGDGRTWLPVPLLLPPGTDIRRGAGFSVRRGPLPETDLQVLHAIPCTTPVRAVFDEMRSHQDLRRAVVALDMALAARLVSLKDLDHYLTSRARWPGLQAVRAATGLADPGSRSPQETHMRLVWVLDAGLPRPLCNPDLADQDGRFIGRPDLLCVRSGVVGEFDGAAHRGRDRHRVDVRREDLFRRAGLEVFTVVGADLRDTALVVDRMRAAVDRAREAGRPRRWLVRA